MSNEEHLEILQLSKATVLGYWKVKKLGLQVQLLHSSACRRGFNWEGKAVMSMQKHSQETMSVDEDDHLPEMGQAWLIQCKKRDLVC